MQLFRVGEDIMSKQETICRRGCFMIHLYVHVGAEHVFVYMYGVGVGGWGGGERGTL